MYRVVAALAVLVFLAAGTVAAADGQPVYVLQGGLGVSGHDGTRYVAITSRNGTVIERVRVAGGSVMNWIDLAGYWGIPAPTTSPTGGEGLTRDGKRLIVATAGPGPTHFAVLATRSLRILDRFTLNGNFAYDALSPDGATLYLIQHVDLSDASRYIVRAYDLNAHTLLPGRIADKTQRDWVMAGWPVTRTSSADGRWAYTLYTRPGGYPFVHALDTVKGVAHCIGLPWTGNQTPLWNVRLTVTGDGKTLAVHWKSGRPWLTLNTATWRLTHVAAGGSAWRWPLAGAVAAALAGLALTVLLFARRRQPREAAPVPL